MKNNCLICNRIAKIKANKNPYFVTELETGYVVIGDYQFYKGYTVFLCKIHTDELHKLKPSFKNKFLQEMALVAEAVYKAFKPGKLNYELLGNIQRHLHWHIFPRYKNDPKPADPVWVVDKKIRYSEKVKPSLKELKILKKQLLTKVLQILQ